MNNKNLKNLFFLLSLIVCGLLGPADADYLKFDYSEEAEIESTNPNFNFGARQSFYVGRSSGTDIYRSLIKFDLSGVPSSAVIDSAKLTMKCIANNGSSEWIKLYRCLRDWGEGVSDNTSANAGEVTWNSAEHGSVSWTTAGAGSDGNDRAATALDSVMVSDTSPFLWEELQGAVQNWVDGSWQNYGLVILNSNESSESRKAFASNEHTNTSERPFLEVWFTDSNRVANYLFSEGSGDSVFDHSANGNHSKFMGGTPAWISGKPAIQFDGSDDYLDIQDANSLDITGNISISVWVKPDSSFSRSIIAKTGTSNKSYALNLSLGKVRFQLSENGLTYNKEVTGSMSITPGSWHHLVGTYDGSHVRVYVNGVIDDSVAATGPINAADAKLNIGSKDNGVLDFFGGAIGHAMIYKTVIDLAKIREIFTADSLTFLAGPTAAVVGDWRFLEGSGDTAYDSSAYHLDAKLFGSMPVWDSEKPALDFNGSNHYLSVPDTNFLDISSQITLSAWVNPNTSMGTIIGKSESGAFSYSLSMMSNKPRFLFSLSGTSWDRELWSDNSMGADTWTHLVVTYDGSKMAMYINGAPDTTWTTTGSIYAGSADFTIGAKDEGTSDFFSGKIGRLQVMNQAVDSAMAHGMFQSDSATYLADPGSLYVKQGDSLYSHWRLQDHSVFRGQDSVLMIQFEMFTTGQEAQYIDTVRFKNLSGNISHLAGGAELKLYADTNNSGKLDTGDRLLGSANMGADSILTFFNASGRLDTIAALDTAAYLLAYKFHADSVISETDTFRVCLFPDSVHAVGALSEQLSRGLAWGPDSIKGPGRWGEAGSLHVESGDSLFMHWTLQDYSVFHGQDSVLMLQFEMRATGEEQLYIDTIKIRNESGNISHLADGSALKLYADTNNSGELDAGDILLASANMGADSVLTFFNAVGRLDTLETFDSVSYLVSYKFHPDSLISKTDTFEVCLFADSVYATGASSGQPMNGIGASFDSVSGPYRWGEAGTLYVETGDSLFNHWTLQDYSVFHGQDTVLMLQFELNATGQEPLYLDTVKIRNETGNISHLAGGAALKLYADTNNSGEVDAEDILLASANMGADSVLTFFNAAGRLDTLETFDTVSYLVSYKFHPDSLISKTDTFTVCLVADSIKLTGASSGFPMRGIGWSEDSVEGPGRWGEAGTLFVESGDSLFNYWGLEDYSIVQGQDSVLMLQFEIFATGQEALYVDTVKISNLSGNISHLAGGASQQLFADTNNSGELDAGDILLASANMGSDSILTFYNASGRLDTLQTFDTVSYLVKYNFHADSALPYADTFKVCLFADSISLTGASSGFPLNGIGWSMDSIDGPNRWGAPPPSNVTSFSAYYIAEDSVGLTWMSSAAAGAESVTVRYKTTGYPAHETDGTWFKNYLNADTADTITGLPEKATYYFGAFVKDSLGMWSDSVNTAYDNVVIPDLTPPDNQLTLTATAIDSDRVQITWNPGSIDSADADSVGIWYKTGNYPGFSGDGTEADVYTLTDSVDTIAGLDQKTVYYFALCVRDSAGHWSDTVTTGCDTARTPDATIPDNVSGFSVNNYDKDSIRLSWMASASADAESIVVRYRTDAFPTGYNNGTLFKSYDNEDTTDTLAGLSEKTMYYFGAFVKDTSGNWSDSINGSYDSVYIPDLTAPDNVTGFSATVFTRDSVSLTWSPSATGDADSVMIRYTENGTFPADTGSGTLWGMMSNSDSTGRVGGLNEKSWYRFSLFVKDSAGLYSTLTTAAKDSAYMPDSTEPDNVTAFSAQFLSSDSAIISFIASASTDAESIFVRYRTDSLPQNETKGTLLIAYPNADQTDTIDGFSEKTTYYFGAFVRDSAGLWSDSVDGSYDSEYMPDVSPPSGITGLTATALSNDSIALAWTKSDSADADSVMIRFTENGTFPTDTGSGSMWVMLTNNDSTTTLFGLSEKRWYRFSLFVKDAAGLYSTLTVDAQDSAYTPDATKPDNVTSFTASYLGGDTAVLSWTGSGSADAESIMVRYSLSDFPENETDGTLLAAYEAAAVTDTIPGLTEKTAYYYTAFVKDTSGNWSDSTAGCYDSVYMHDITQPANVTGFSATVFTRDSVSLTWSPSATGDADSVMIRYTENGTFPADTGSGTLWAMMSNIDSTGRVGGLNEKSWYRFSLFVKDSAGLYSALTTAAKDSAYMPDSTEPDNVSSFAANFLGSDSVEISFIAPSSADAESIFVRYRTDSFPANETNGTLLAAYTNADQTDTVDGLTEKTTYYIGAFVRDSAGLWSDTLAGTYDTVYMPDVSAPSGVTGLSASALSNDSVVLSWTASDSTDADSVMIRYTENGTFPADTGSGTLWTMLSNSELTDTLHGLNEKKWYRFSLFVKDNAGLYSVLTVDAQDSAYTPDATKPDNVTSFTASYLGGDTAVLSWTGSVSADAESIMVRYSLSDFPETETDGTLLASYEASAVTDTIPGLTEKAEYYYTAFVKDSSGNWSDSAAGCYDSVYMLDISAPSGVTGLTATAISSDSIILTWTPSDSADADSVMIRYTENGTFPTDTIDGTLWAMRSNTVSSDTLFGLTEKYWYRFRLFVKDSAGLYSVLTVDAQDSAYTPDATKPDNVTSFAASYLGGDTAVLSWVASASSDAESIMVRYSLSDFPANKTVGTLVNTYGKTATTDTLPGLTEKAEYYYTAFVKDSSGNWSDSAAGCYDSVYMVDISAPAGITNLSATALSKDSITLSWTVSDSADADSVMIRYTEDGTFPTDTGSGTLWAMVSNSDSADTLHGLNEKKWYRFSLFVKDNAGHYSVITASAQDSAYTPDETEPDNVTAFSVTHLSGDSAILSFIASASADAESIFVRYRTDSFPANETNGTLLKGYANATMADTIGGFLEKTTYFFGLFVRDSTGLWSDSANGSYNTEYMPDVSPPCNVTALTATAISNDSIVLSWTPPDSTDTDSIMIRYTENGSFPSDTGSGILWNTVSNASVKDTLYGLNEKSWYRFSLFAKDAAGHYSALTTAAQDSAYTPDATKPDNVTSFAATYLSGDTAVLSWTASGSADAESIMVRYSLSDYPEIETDGTLLAAYEASTITDTIPGLTEKTAYYYTAFVKDTSGNWSDSATGCYDSVYMPDISVPSGVTGLTATAISSDSIALAWTKSDSADADSVMIRFTENGTFPTDTGSGSMWVMLTNNDSTTTLFGLSEKSWYRFSLFVKDNAGLYSVLTVDAQDSAYTPDATKPDNVVSFDAVNGNDDTLYLSWTPSASADAESLVIRYRTNGFPVNQGDGTLLASLSAHDSVLTCTGLPEKTTYYFACFVKDSSGNWSDSTASANDAAVVPDITPPENVTDLYVSSAGDRFILTWTSSTAADAESLTIRYRTDGFPADQTDGTLWAYTPADADSEVVTGLSEKTQYYFGIFVKDTAGYWSAASIAAQDSAILPDQTVPENVSGFTADYIGSGNVLITWDAPDASDAEVVEVFYSLDGSYPADHNDGSQYQSFNAAAGQDTVTDLQDKRIYYFAAFVRDSSGNWSPADAGASDTARMPDLTAPVNNLVIDADATGPSRIEIIWDPSDNAEPDIDSIEVRYSTDSIPLSRSDDPLAFRVPVTDSQYILTDLIGNQDYYFTSFVRDSSGNWSAYSNRCTARARTYSTPPVLAPIPDTAIYEKALWQYTVTASDADGDSVAVTVLQGPPSLTIDEAGVIRWDPRNRDVGGHSLVVMAADAHGETDTASCSLTVVNVNDPPRVSGFTLNSNVWEDSLVNDTLFVQDPDRDDTVRITAARMPSWLTLSFIGKPLDTLFAWTITGVPLNEHVGDTAVSFIVQDADSARDSADYNLTVLNTNDAPILSAVSLPDTGWEDSVYTAALRLRDVDRNDTLRFRFISGPAWLTLPETLMVPDSLGYANVSVSGTPLQPDTGINHFTVRVLDIEGAADTLAFSCYIMDGNDPPETYMRPPIVRDGAARFRYYGVDDYTTRLLYKWTFSRIQAPDTADTTNGDSGTATISVMPYAVVIDSGETYDLNADFYPLTDGAYIFRVAAVDSQELADSIPEIDTILIAGANYHVFRDSTWIMISVPAAAYTVDSSVMQGAVLHWNEEKAQDNLYDKYDRHISRMNAGESYWALLDDDAVVSLEETDFPESTVTLSLQKVEDGWNQISSPYPYPVQLAAADSNFKLWRWDPDSMDYIDAGGLMKPWQGYWLQVDTSRDMDVPVQPFFGTDSLVMAKRLNASYKNERNWKLQIVATNGKARDRENYFGLSPKAKDGYDAADYGEPPAIDQRLSVFFPHDEWDRGTMEYTTDIRKSVRSVNEWQFGVTKPVNSDGNLNIELRGIASVPEKYYVYLCDKGKYVDLKKEPSYKCNAGHEKTYYSVIVTDDPDYLKKIPGSFALQQNFPNPFNPVTSIRYSVPPRWRPDGWKESGAVPMQISIYNIRGQLIKHLVDGPTSTGHHIVRWNSRDTYNRHVASGMYIYRVKAPGFFKAKRMVLLK